MHDSQLYPHQFSEQARARVEAERLRAAKHLDAIRKDPQLRNQYSIERLHSMKREHEELCAKVIRTGASKGLGARLLALGPDVICMCDIENISARSWTLRLKYFVKGDVHSLIAFISNFAKAAERDKYILSNELGDGRVLSRAPSLEDQRGSYILFCPIESAFPRIDAQDLGSSYALHPETNDQYVDEKGLARVAGLDSLPQKIEAVLSMQQGENLFAPSAGIRFFEFFQEYSGSPWLTWILNLDVVRQASIPFTDAITGWRYTPLQCVARVRNFELLSESPKNNRLPVHVDLDVQGVGRWQRDLSIYVPTPEQMAERAKTVAHRSPLIRIPKQPFVVTSLKEGKEADNRKVRGKMPTRRNPTYKQIDAALRDISESRPLHEEVFQSLEGTESIGEPRISEPFEYRTETHYPMHYLADSGEFSSQAQQPLIEHSIRRLPPILQARVEGVRAQAELQHRSDVRNPDKIMDECVADYVCTVFWAYLAQARAAASEEGWTAEELRHSVDAQLRNEIESAFASKHPVGLNPAIADSKAAIFGVELRAYMPTAADMEASFRAELIQTITNDPKWEDYQNDLQNIAANQISASPNSYEAQIRTSDHLTYKGQQSPPVVAGDLQESHEESAEPPRSVTSLVDKLRPTLDLEHEMGGSDTALDRRPRAAVSGSDAAEARPYPNRALWLPQEMATRGISAYRLYQHGGPDRDTTKKILKGCSVRSDALENLLRGLSATGEKVLPAQIPNN